MIIWSDSGPIPSAMAADLAYRTETGEFVVEPVPL